MLKSAAPPTKAPAGTSVHHAAPEGATPWELKTGSDWYVRQGVWSLSREWVEAAVCPDGCG